MPLSFSFMLLLILIALTFVRVILSDSSVLFSELRKQDQLWNAVTSIAPGRSSFLKRVSQKVIAVTSPWLSPATFVYADILFDFERLCEISGVRSQDSQTVESVLLNPLFVQH